MTSESRDLQEVKGQTGLCVHSRKHVPGGEPPGPSLGPRVKENILGKEVSVPGAEGDHEEGWMTMWALSLAVAGRPSPGGFKQRLWRGEAWSRGGWGAGLETRPPARTLR